MLFLVLLNVWCSHPAFLKMVPHPAPAGPYELVTCLPVFHLHIPTCGSLLQVQSSCSQVERGLREFLQPWENQITRLHLCEAEREAVGAELLPSVIWGSSGQQGCTTAGDSTCGPQQPQSLQDRVQRGAQEKDKCWEDGNCWEPGLELELLCIPTEVLQKSRLNQLC